VVALLTFPRKRVRDKGRMSYHRGNKNVIAAATWRTYGETMKGEPEQYGDVVLAVDERDALSAAGLLGRFAALSPDNRLQHHEWIAKASLPEARRYRITEMCEMLSPEDRVQRRPAPADTPPEAVD